MSSDSGITLSNVSRTFVRGDGQRVTAVDSVNLAVPEGEFVCLVGHSGCGKSTLLQMVSGLMPTSGGAIAVGSKPVTGPSPERGFVFQKDSVFPWMRVIDNVEYGLKRRGIATAERRKIAEKYLDLVGLSHVARAWPKELSGGMLKRVAIATVFANGAEVLLLDEPFAALDYVTKRQLHDVLLALWGDASGPTRRTVLFVTHDVDEALLLADRIVVVHEGRIVDDLKITAERPRSADTLATPPMLSAKHTLLAHLGLERPQGQEARA